MTTVDDLAASGDRWPAEWEPHQATWVAWPHNPATWPGRFAGISARFAALVRALAEHELVYVLAGGDDVRREAERMVGKLANVVLLDIRTNDAWVRDYGPMFVQRPRNAELLLIDWQFNAWGGKYPPWDEDNRVPRRVANHLRLPAFTMEEVLEGGSVDGNGQGAVLTTESCLLDHRRNLNMTRQRAEQMLARGCGAREVIWLPGGAIAGDDTDGHVDQLARFVAPHRVVVAVEENEADENYQPLQDNLRALESYRESRHAPLEIVRLPMPARIEFDRHRVPASYCNFYIANGCVVVPIFDVPEDAEAIETLAELFPGRRIIPLAARDVIWGLGAWHCLTQQHPAPPSVS